MSIGTGDGLMPSQALDGAERNAWWFELPYASLPPGLSMNDRGKHWAKTRSTAMVRKDVVALVAQSGVPAMGRIRVDVTWFVKTKHRRDTDNAAPLLKAIYDAIGSDRGVSAHIVADDAPEFMEKPGATIHYDKECTPHFVVTITRLDGAA